jgi:hypothetical protein
MKFGVSAALWYINNSVLLESGRNVKIPIKKRMPSVKHKQWQHRYQDLEKWGTDDSDWDYSDEETRAKQHKNSKCNFIYIITSKGLLNNFGLAGWAVPP